MRPRACASLILLLFDAAALAAGPGPIQAAQQRGQTKVVIEGDMGDEAEEQPPRVVGAPDWKLLASLAVKHGVILPPPEARLVLFNTGARTLVGNESTSRDPGIFVPGFLLEEKGDGGAVVLRGKERVVVEVDGLRKGERAWRTFSAGRVVPELGGYAVSFTDLDDLVCAVQAAQRGDEAAAAGIWGQFTQRWWSDDWDAKDALVVQRQATAFLGEALFKQLFESIGEAGADLRAIYTRMEGLLAAVPMLKADEDHVALLADLGTTLDAPAPAAGTIEALLMEWARRPIREWGVQYFREGEEGDETAPGRAILLRGLDAVTDLARLGGDRRVTAHLVPAFMNAGQRIARVGDLARGLLREITGGDKGLEGIVADADKVRAWLGEARRGGEAAFFAGALFTRKGSRITEVNQTVARILAERYPEALPRLCDEFTKDAQPEASPAHLTIALAACRLPKDRRVEVLAAFARRGPLGHRRTALAALAALDGAACAAILLPLLDSLAHDATGPYWTSPEAGLAQVVMAVEDDGVWRALLRAARRGAVGLRLEMMNPLNHSATEGRNRGRRLAFLSAFLDDAAGRDLAADPEKYGGPCAAFTFPKIEVRNFAAMKIACLLGLCEATPDEFWDAEQWERLRAVVRDKLAASAATTTRTSRRPDSVEPRSATPPPGGPPASPAGYPPFPAKGPR